MRARLLAAFVVLSAFLSSPSTAQATPDAPFVAHEWGTFTSVQGSDGVQLEWTPLIKTDLPRFVYAREASNGLLKSTAPGYYAGKESPSYLRMETPVIYFYSSVARTVDVRVLFANGRITEWYPQATRLDPKLSTSLSASKGQNPNAVRSVIEWTGVHVLPPRTAEISADKLIRDPSGEEGNHYYAARETDANLLRVNSRYARGGAEYERDLFYRGIGYFPGPLIAKLTADESELALATSYPEPLIQLFVLTINRGTARYERVDRVLPGTDRIINLQAQPFGALVDVRAQLMRDMVTALTAQGLYAKEAQAMVNTWKDQWFSEEGTRVLYLLPQSWTDQVLPLVISPQPDSIKRVMVGRSELITPSMEKTLRDQLTIYRSSDPQARRRAVAAVRRLGIGRFLEPAMRRILDSSTDRLLLQAGWSLAYEASQPHASEALASQPAQDARRIAN